MSAKTTKLRYSRTIVLWVVAGLAVAAIGVGVYLYFSRDNNPIPPALRSKLTFSPLTLPKDTKNFSTTNYEFIANEEGTLFLHFRIHAENSVINVSEYTQPSQFAEVPGYKDSFLTNVIQQYATVQTSNGTIYLGRSPLQKNMQLAIMVERGLIVFMKPDKELDATQWRVLGDQFEIEKIAN